MLKEFKEFVMRGSVVDLAVGIIIGSAFTAIVNSLVNDAIMPPIGLILGNVDFSDLYLLLRSGNPAGTYNSLVEAQTAGAVTIDYGLFVNNVVAFIIVSFTIFLLIRGINRLNVKKETEAADVTTKTCPFCAETIPVKATRCPHCPSQLEGAASGA